MAGATVTDPHVTSFNVSCPEIAQRYAAPEDIPLRSGLIDLPALDAQINLPPDMRFVDAPDAKAYMRYENQWPKCSVAPLVGLIVPPKNWLKAGGHDFSDAWIIELYYHRGYVSDEDIISTDYNEIVQQVRESYYDREQADSAWGGYGEYRHVIGWAISPELNYSGGSLIWALHIAEGNRSNYSVPIHMAYLGRHGHFRLYMRGLISRNEANGGIMRKAGQSIKFHKGARHGDRFVGQDPEPVTTIGQMVAKSVTARLATPLTWREYFSAVSYGLWQLVIHYLLELLVFATLALFVLLFSWLRHSLFKHSLEDFDFADDDRNEICRDRGSHNRDHVCPVTPVSGIANSYKPTTTLLNGLPLDRAK